MIQHIVSKPVGGNGVIDIVILIGVPVVRQFLWAEYKDRLVAIFVVFNNSKSGKCFTKTYAVREDAAIVFFELVDNSEGSIPLEVIEHPPNLAFLKTSCFVGQNIFGYIFQKLIEDVIKRDEVDKIRSVLAVCGCNAVYHLIGNSLKHLAVIPNLIKVGKQGTGKRLIFYDCGADHIALFTAQFNCREVIDGGIADIVYYDLPLNRLVTDIRLKSDFSFDPLCALTCNSFLGQLISELDFKFCSVKASFTIQARNIEFAPFLISLFSHESWRCKNKAKFINLRELLFQFLKSINRKACCRDRYFAALLDF